MIPHSHCIRLFLLLLFSVKVLSASLNDHCPESQCGGTKITYPFYLTNPSPPTQQPASSAFCGYRGFGVECDRTTNTPIFKLSGDSYVVKEIDSGSSRLRLTDVEISTIDCPKPGHNLTLGAMTPVLKLDPGTTNFTFLIDCSYYPFLVPAPSSPGYPKQPPSSIDTIVTPIKCLDSPVANSSRLNYSYALRPFSATIRTDWASLCSRYVIVPYSGNQTEVVQSAGSFPSVVKGGFVLEWGTKDAVCVECEDSGGRCGYLAVNSSQFPVPACFCGDGTLGDPVCRAGTAMKGGKKVKVIAGVSAGSSALILGMLLTVCYFLYYRKRKRPSPSTVYFIRSLSSSKTSSSLTDMESRSFHQRCGDRVTVFTYRELQEATDDFNSSNEIGDGGFGAVYLGKLHDGRKVAVKKLYENNFRRVEQFMNEIGILSCIEHPNLVQLYGCTSRHSRELLLVYEYIDNGTVSDHIHGSRSAKGHPTWKVRLTIAIETAEALAYLHRLDPPIIHRDVKTSNILLDKRYHVKVADFGLSRLFPVDVTHVSTAPQGTPGYVDPEYHKCYQLTDKSDVYSFGVVLAELISSLPAVDIRRHRHEINLANFAVNKIQNHELHAFVDSSIGFETDQWVKKTVTAVADMAFRCLSTERDVRPTMDEVAESLRKIELEGIKQGKTTAANSLRKIESEGPKQGKTTVANSLRKIESEGPKQGKTEVANSLRKIESEGPKQGKTAVANSLRKMEPRRSEPEEAAAGPETAAGPESQKEAGAVPKAAGPLSPNSVTDKWPSHYSTPNNSG